jgi:hypothetical protein
MNVIIDHISSHIDKFPVRLILLDDFLFECTPFPLSIFLESLTCSTTRGHWFDAVGQVCQSSWYDPKHVPMFENLLIQLTNLWKRTPIQNASSEDRLQQIWDPLRERKLHELFNDTYINRLHICNLINTEMRHEPRTQLQLLMEPLLDNFPPRGLEATCATDLLKAYLRHVQH